MTCPNCGQHISGLRVGDVLRGFCGGYFGRDSYGDKTVVHVALRYVVVSEQYLSRDGESWETAYLLYSGDPSELLEYRNPPDNED